MERTGPSEVSLEEPGRLYLASLDDVDALFGDEDRSASAVLEPQSIDLVVCLVEDGELDDYPAYRQWLQDDRRGRRVPIPDHGTVPVSELIAAGNEVAAAVERGETVVIHCFAGLGRTSLVATAALAASDGDVESALRRVQTQRPGAGPETPAQHQLIETLALSLG